MFDSQYLWLFLLLVAFGSFSQGFTGIGFGIIILAGVAFTPWNFERTTVVVNILILFLNVILIYASRKDARVNWRLVGYILLGSAIGVPAGYWFVVTLGDQPLFRVVFGIVLVAFAINELVRPKIRKPLPLPLAFSQELWVDFLMGLLRRLGRQWPYMSTPRHKEPALLKGTLQLLFLITNIWRLVTILVFGNGNWLPVIKLAILALPVVLLLTYLDTRQAVLFQVVHF
jgi:uncharacterized membrane protein YfcA